MMRIMHQLVFATTEILLGINIKTMNSRLRGNDSFPTIPAYTP